jgi:very-short-patch-repair endonuclease
MGFAEVLALAEMQHGVVAQWQARSLHLSSKQICLRITRDELERLTPNVLRARGAASTDHQRAMAAVLDAGPGSVLSHQSAAALWGLPSFDFRNLHVTRLRSGRRHAPLAIEHRPRSLLAVHVTTLEGIPATTPARTIFDLAAVLRLGRVARALDTAWSRRLLDGVRIAAVLDDLGKRGRKGTTVMRELLAERGPDYIPPDSGLEGRFHDIVTRAGLPKMRRQVDVGGVRWLGRVDFVDPELPLIVQIDSELHHSALIDKAADESQTADLRAAGFTVLRFTDFQVWYRADEVVTEIRKRRAVLARGEARVGR